MIHALSLSNYVSPTIEEKKGKAFVTYGDKKLLLSIPNRPL